MMMPKRSEVYRPKKLRKELHDERIKVDWCLKVIHCYYWNAGEMTVHHCSESERVSMTDSTEERGRKRVFLDQAEGTRNSAQYESDFSLILAGLRHRFRLVYSSRVEQKYDRLADRSTTQRSSIDQIRSSISASPVVNFESEVEVEAVLRRI